MTKQLPEELFAAYEWIQSAGEWDEALAEPTKYAAEAAENARQNDVTDVTETDLLSVIEWFRKNER